MHKILVLYFICINIFGVCVMYSDKEKAKHGHYRIPEKTLWRIAIVGGALGTTIGMHQFRHKTKHPTFKFGFPILAAMEIVILLWILI